MRKLLAICLLALLSTAASADGAAFDVKRLDPELSKFYSGLLASEARHFQGYIRLAHLYGEASDIARRIEVIRPVEQALIAEPDIDFRFHSGPPLPALAAG